MKFDTLYTQATKFYINNNKINNENGLKNNTIN